MRLYPTGQAGAAPLRVSGDWTASEEFRASDGPVAAVTFGPDGRTVVTVGHGEPVRVWTVTERPAATGR